MFENNKLSLQKVLQKLICTGSQAPVPTVEEGEVQEVDDTKFSSTSSQAPVPAVEGCEVLEVKDTQFSSFSTCSQAPVPVAGNNGVGKSLFRVGAPGACSVDR